MEPFTGTIGTRTQIALSSPFPNHLHKLSHILQNLLETQLPSGNFPSSLDSSHKDILVQFCHGAPGFIISFYSLLPHFPELTKPLQSAIQKAEKCVLERGILTEESMFVSRRIWKCSSIEGSRYVKISQTLL